jgi:hypothetical protein
MAMDELETGIVIKFNTSGFDVLAKLPKMLDSAAVSSDRLTKSVGGLNDVFGTLGPLVASATSNITGFTAAAIDAAAATRGLANASRAVTTGLGGSGGAARAAQRDFAALRNEIVATQGALAASAAASGVTMGALGSTALRSSVIGPLALSASTSGATSAAGSLAASTSASLASTGGGLGVIPPTVGNAYRFNPATGGPLGGGGGAGPGGPLGASARAAWAH